MLTIDTSTEFGTRIARRLAEEQVIWLTTVGRSGTPAPNPVWFLWHDGQVLIASQPAKAKVANVQANPRVAVNFNATFTGHEVGVLSGAAVIDPDGLTAAEQAAYDAKYAEPIKGFGMTPDDFHADYSVVIRVTPDKLRGF